MFLRRNCGQTAALSAALDLARGEILVPIDGDRQNDPADIPRLLKELEAGYDVVSGWRRDRHDAFVSRKVPSWIANRLVARLSGVVLHDFGCTLKAYRRRVLEGVRLYGEMHRFIPIFAAWQGARVTELVVNHRPRTAGRTKYGLGRTFHVVLDLILIRFLQLLATPPALFRAVRLMVVRPGHAFVPGDALFQVHFSWPYLWWAASCQAVRRNPPTLLDRHVLPGRRHEHPPGHPVGGDHADLLRDATQDHVFAGRGSPGNTAGRRKSLTAASLGMFIPASLFKFSFGEEGEGPQSSWKRARQAVVEPNRGTSGSPLDPLRSGRSPRHAPFYRTNRRDVLNLIKILSEIIRLTYLLDLYR